MAETQTPPTAPTEGGTATVSTPTTGPQSPYAQVTKDLTTAKSWDAIAPKTPEPVAEPVADPAPDAVAVETAQPDAPPEAFTGWTLDASHRLHRPDGTYASVEEIAAYNTGAEPAGEPVADPTEEAKPETPQPERVTIKGRDGSDVEIEVDDPKIAEALRTNAKDGMRAREYREKVAVVDQKLAEFNAFERLLETNPEHVIFNALPEAKRVSLATALVAQYWDQIAPTLVQFDTAPESRVRTAAETQIAMRDGMAQYQQRLQADRQGADLAKAVIQLLPESLPDHLHEQFLADAQSDITRAIQRGERVTPETVPTLLATRLSLYGATTPTPAPVARVRAVASPSPSQPAAAQPVGAAAASLATVQANQDRLKAAQHARRRAAAVPPSGAGAAPVRLTPVGPGTSIKDASADLKKLTHW